MLNQEQFFRKWGEIKDAIRNVWGNIEEEELNETNGDLTSLYHVIQNHTMETPVSIQDKIQTIFNAFDNETDKTDNILDDSSYQRKPFLQ